MSSFILHVRLAFRDLFTFYQMAFLISMHKRVTCVKNLPIKMVLQAPVQRILYKHKLSCDKNMIESRGEQYSKEEHISYRWTRETKARKISIPKVGFWNNHNVSLLSYISTNICIYAKYNNPMRGCSSTIVISLVQQILSHCLQLTKIDPIKSIHFVVKHSSTCRVWKYVHHWEGRLRKLNRKC